MADDTDALFIFGDDLEAILDALEEDEGVQEEFSAAVNNVSVENWIFDSNCRSNKLKNLHDLPSYVTNTLAIILPMCVLYILYVYIVSENSTKCVVCQKKVCYNTLGLSTALNMNT